MTDTIDDEIFSADRKFVLASGRNIRLEWLQQYQTYVGLLSGLPYQAMNDEIIKHHLESAKKRCYDGTDPILLPPLDYPAEFSRAAVIEWIKAGLGPPILLPPIACIGDFVSYDDPTETCPYGISRVVVAWFQPTFGLPTGEVLAQLRAIDWDAHAADASP